MKLNLEKIQLLQARKCLNTIELTEITGLSRASISRALNGKTEPNPKTVGLIAKALGVDVAEIIK